MANVSVLNTTNQLSGKTLPTAEGDYTITGNHTYDRDPSAPYTVTSGSAKVTNLDADKLDGLEGAAYATLTGSETLTNKTLTAPTLTTPTVSSGVLTVTSGQIAFPAVQAASAGANTLDDYEENTWTPVDGGAGGLTLTVNSAQYAKIGQMVFASFDVTYPSTADTNAALIGGLPFTSQTVGCWGGSINISGYATPVTLGVTSNALTAQFFTFNGAAVQNVALSTLRMRGTAIYRASA